MEKTYKLGTRTSPLAIKQVEEILKKLDQGSSGINIKVVGINTRGDKDRLTPISSIEGTDFFTKEIDEALVKGDIDIAVHSAKDLPDEIKEGITVAAVTDSIDPYDVLVSGSGRKVDELRPGARIGTSSRRRKEQLMAYRDDFEIVDIRGNIEERIGTLEKGGMDLDAIVIASAGLIRLGLENRITQRLGFDIMRPHELQGALAVMIRKNEEELKDKLKILDKRFVAREVEV